MSFLYYFLKYDNFSKDHVFITNYLLCDPPIDNEKELINSCVNRRFKDKKMDSDKPSFKFSQFELFLNKTKEFYRLCIETMTIQKEITILLEEKNYYFEIQ